MDISQLEKDIEELVLFRETIELKKNLELKQNIKTELLTESNEHTKFQINYLYLFIELSLIACLIVSIYVLHFSTFISSVCFIAFNLTLANLKLNSPKNDSISHREDYIDILIELITSLLKYRTIHLDSLDSTKSSLDQDYIYLDSSTGEFVRSIESHYPTKRTILQYDEVISILTSFAKEKAKAEIVKKSNIELLKSYRNSL